MPPCDAFSELFSDFTFAQLGLIRSIPRTFCLPVSRVGDTWVTEDDAGTHPVPKQEPRDCSNSHFGDSNRAKVAAVRGGFALPHSRTRFFVLVILICYGGRVPPRMTGECVGATAAIVPYYREARC